MAPAPRLNIFLRSLSVATTALPSCGSEPAVPRRQREEGGRPWQDRITAGADGRICFTPGGRPRWWTGQASTCGDTLATRHTQTLCVVRNRASSSAPAHALGCKPLLFRAVRAVRVNDLPAGGKPAQHAGPYAFVGVTTLAPLEPVSYVEHGSVLVDQRHTRLAYH